MVSHLDIFLGHPSNPSFVLQFFFSSFIDSMSICKHISIFIFAGKTQTFVDRMDKCEIIIWCYSFNLGWVGTIEKVVDRPIIVQYIYTEMFFCRLFCIEIELNLSLKIYTRQLYIFMQKFQQKYQWDWAETFV